MDPNEALCMILSCKLTSKTKARVKERVQAGKCLCCDGVAVKRGLCLSHYNSWKYQRRPLSKVSQIKYDRDLIIKGQLLEAYGAGEYRNANTLCSLIVG